jgi:hypothetical protein
MKKYKIGVLGLSETRWLQAGQLRLSSGEQLLTQETQETELPTQEQVTLLVAPEAQALIGWELVNSCTITAKLTTKNKGTMQRSHQ